MKSAENLNYLIAVNEIVPERSRLLLKTPSTEITEEDLATANPPFDPDDFAGKGYRIYLCEKIPLIEDPQELAERDYSVFNLNLEGELCSYEEIEAGDAYPLIEGAFVPGIYRIPEDSDYLVIKDIRDLTEIYTGQWDDYFEVGKAKLVCSGEAVEWRVIENDELYDRAKRLPFTYFDIQCPLCGQKIMTSCADPRDQYHRCRIYEDPCPHFVGHAIMPRGDRWQAEALDQLDINYKMEGADLYFETSRGWQKAIIYLPLHDPDNSFYDGGVKQDDDADYMFFVESE